MKLTPTEALKRIPVSADTLYKDMKSGKLSYEKKGARKRLIDVAELERVYGTLKSEPDETISENVSSDIRSDKGRYFRESSGAETEVALLRQQVQMLLDERRREREQTQEQMDDLKAALKTAQDQQMRLTALLTDQRREKDGKEAHQQALVLKELRQLQLRLDHELKQRERGFFARWLGVGGKKKQQTKAVKTAAPQEAGA